MIDRSVGVAAGVSDGVVVVVPAAELDHETSMFAAMSTAMPRVGVTVVSGGSTRSAS
ncbi:MAG: hypothetical protein JWN99_1048, partial [Ilumatobacteraceae bacterium]|nr:hypothetical protein [Ilumatobacteraceae bacterium]